MPIGVGERTENLYNWETDISHSFITSNGTILSLGASSANYVSEKIHVVAGKTYQLIRPITVRGTGLYAAFYDENDAALSVTTLSLNASYALEAPTGASYFRTSLKRNDAENDISMLTEGSTAPETYIPYGYKLPILSNSTVTNIYLGEVETTRRIKKLVLTGEEGWELWSSGQPDFERYYYKWGKTTPSDYRLICTHLPFNYGDGNFEHVRLGGSNREDFIIFISKTIAPTVADFKSYLAAQYANSTPVTIWYVLANPTTGIVNEPIRKIGDYADTVSMEQSGVSIPTSRGSTVIDYDGTTKPSQMYVKYYKS